MTEKTKAFLKIESILVAIIVCACLLLFCSCAAKERLVTVPEVHDHWHYKTDSVHHTDSVIRERKTTIMKLDSAEMARYGIRLQKAERAWLIETAELQRQIKCLEAMSMMKDSVHDTIPKPYPVTKEVPAQLSWWQKTRLYIANALLIAIVIYLLYLFILKKRVFHIY